MRSTLLLSVLVACNAAPDSADELCANAFFVDADGDQHGDPFAPLTSACSVPDGYAVLGDDCDDTNVAIHGGADEICDTIDNDCDEDIDEEAVNALGLVRRRGRRPVRGLVEDDERVHAARAATRRWAATATSPSTR